MDSGLVTKLTEQLDPAGCVVINLPCRIWVFGGPTEHPNNPAGSLRDCFWRRTLTGTLDRPWAKHLARPEEFQDWWAFSGYHDLLTFERDACHLARAIILFVESPGALAELGCLASHDTILPKVLTVVQRQYYAEDARQSFLRLGPLKRVQECGEECVIATNNNAELPEDDFNAIIETIDEWLKDNPQRTGFKPNEPAHILLLTADLVDLMLVSKQIQIDTGLKFYGVNFDNKTLEQNLELLSFFKLIKKEIRGKEIFWVRAPGSDGPWIDHKANDGGTFSRERFKIGALEHVNRNPRLKCVYERLP